MSFLDEIEIRTTKANLAATRGAAEKDDIITVVDEMVKEANAFVAAADAARDRGDKEFEFPKGSGKMHKVTIKRDLDLEEGKLANALGGVALLAGLLLMNKINSSDPVIQRLKAEYEKVEGNEDAQDSIQDLLTKRLIFLDSGEFDNTTPMDEAKKTVELPADTTFTLDLKHLMKKHMDEGKSQEDVVKLTKALMAKLHDKGKVTVDGTKVIFKENQDDTQLALPEPDAPDYLGDDGMDYEGGMAKSQILKMKKYATALCDMVEDETQLEAWVQSKITKASDYMSSVYHYLDYQRSKMNEENILQEAMRINPEKISPETRQMYDDGKRFFDIASSLLRNTSSLEKIMPLFLDLYSKELRFNSIGDQEKAQAIEALENTLYKFTQG